MSSAVFDLRRVATIGMTLAGLAAAGCSGGDNRAAATTGSGGSGGVAVLGCTASSTSKAPADGLIADFMDAAGGPDAGGVEIMGGVITYAGPIAGGPGSPAYTTTGGTLNVTEGAAATSAAQYVGVIVYFTNCIDASAFTGVQFTISGSFSGCTMQYSTNDGAHEDAMQTQLPGGDRYATGPAGSYSPQAQLTAAQVTSTPTTISMPFSGAGAPAGGSPVDLALDTTKLRSVLWQFAIPVAAAAVGDGGAPMTCTASLTIDDVRFYN